jgi:hypothetical protein
MLDSSGEAGEAGCRWRRFAVVVVAVVVLEEWCGGVNHFDCRFGDNIV